MKNELSILLVEDDKYISHLIKKFLLEYGIVKTAKDSQEAFRLINQEDFDLAIVDLNLEETLKGLEVLQKAKSEKIYTIILSSYENHQATRMAYQLGCDHFLKKENFQKSLGAYLNLFIKEHQSFDFEKYFAEKFLTHDSSLIREIKNLSRINLEDRCLLITGPTGVGKTHLAKLLHSIHGDHKNFVHLNCSEVPENLIESELFGYTKGAFTGADKNKNGLLKQAHGGTLFLDEIATMPIYTQQKLLKAIEEKEFYPLGSENPVKVNFTLISATCEDIQEKIKQNSFRKDLFFRISGFELFIPPLRLRKSDIRMQIDFFLKKSERRFFIEEEVLQSLEQYSWPGNTRELKKLIDNLSQTKEGIIHSHHPMIPKQNHLTDSQVLSAEQKAVIYQKGFKAFISSIEEEILSDVLKSEEGSASRCIKKLGISSSTYYRMLKDHQNQLNP